MNITRHACTMCSLIFPTNSKLIRHIDSHSIIGGYFCEFCERRFRRDENLVEHWRQACPAIIHLLSLEERKNLAVNDFKEVIYRFILHMKSDEIKEQLNDTKLTISTLVNGSTCEYCNILMPFNTIDRHHEVHCNKSLPGEAIRSRNNNQAFACDLCGLGFRMKKYLFQHWRESCSELLAQIPLEGLILNDDELKMFVSKLVRKATIKVPTNIEAELVKKEETKSEKKKYDYVQYFELTDDYDDNIIPPLSIDRGKWSSNKQLAVKCEMCDRKFANKGRLETHESIYHEDWKIHDQCELCLSGFKKKCFFVSHLRKSCCAMKVEIPEDEKRELMSAAELLNIVRRTKHIWNNLFKKQREECYERMKDFLDRLEILKRNVYMRPSSNGKIQLNITRPYPKLYLPPLKQNEPTNQIPSTSKDSNEDIDNKCPICNVQFKNRTIVKRHILVIHKMDAQHVEIPPIPPMKKKKETTSPIYYDTEGKSYFIGEYLEDSVLKSTKLPNKMISGIKIRHVDEEKNKSNIYTIVIVKGNPDRYLVVHESQIDLISNKNGAVKEFFLKKPAIHEDFPVLERQS